VAGPEAVVYARIYVGGNARRAASMSRSRSRAESETLALSQCSVDACAALHAHASRLPPGCGRCSKMWRLRRHPLLLVSCKGCPTRRTSSRQQCPCLCIAATSSSSSLFCQILLYERLMASADGCEVCVDIVGLTQLSS